MTLLPTVQPAILLSSALTAQARAIEKSLTTCRRRPKRGRVHALRVAVRTLLATLELASALEVRTRPRATRSLEKLLDLLSPLRDVHVQLKSLQKLEHAPQAIETLRRHLRRRKRKLAQQARRQLRRFDSAQLGRDLHDVTTALATLSPDPRQRELVATALQGELASRHLRVLRRQQAQPLDDAHHLHRLRLELKGYRYALDTLAPVLPARASSLAQDIAQLQELLGHAHDAHTLAKIAKKSGNEAKTVAEWLASKSEQEQTKAAAEVAKHSFDWPMT